MNIAAVRMGGTMDTTNIRNTVSADMNIRTAMVTAVTATVTTVARKAVCAAN